MKLFPKIHIKPKNADYFCPTKFNKVKLALSYLQVENIYKSFGDLSVLEDISFGISQNQRVAMVARNGSGKTTLLNIITGKDSADSGKVVFRNDLKIGYLEQNPVLIESASILENVFVPDDTIGKAIRTYEKALQGENKEAPRLYDILA